MSTTDIYYPHGIDFNGTEITQLDALPLAMNQQPYSVASASAVFPGLTGTHGSDPIMQFSSTQLADIFGLCTVDELAGAITGGNTDIEWRKASSLTGRVALATSGHVRARATKCLLCWESFEAGNGSLASISCRAQMISDGTNAPIALSTGVALGVSSAVNDVYTLGGVTVTTASLSSELCVKSVRWNNNLQYRSERCNGTGYVIYAAVENARPTLTLMVEDITKPLALLNNGENMTGLTVYLRHKVQGGLNVANATASHIKITATAGQAQATGPREIVVYLHNFTIDTASAIT